VTAAPDRPPGSPWHRVAYVLRHLLSVLLLPVTVSVLVPIWIARSAGIRVTVPRGVVPLVAAASGAVVFTAGLLLFAASLHQFFAFGRGTLAPWDPPRRLVVRGPYRYVRNPMISGVIFILFGTALMLRSIPHAQWAVAFLVINAVYIPLFEEPFLDGRFGEDYWRYCRNVRRFVPRLVPWRQRSDDRETGPK